MTVQLLIHLFIITIVPVCLAFYLVHKTDTTLTRKPYIWRVIGVFVVATLYGNLLNTLFEPPVQGFVNLGVTAGFNLLIFMWGFQRMRDGGMRNHAFWLFLVPILNLLFVLALMFLPTRKPANSEYAA